METNTASSASPSVRNRTAALYGLAGVGFIALVGAGIWLAVYASRYVPTVVDELAAATVSLTQLFSGNSSSTSPSTNASTTPAQNPPAVATTTTAAPPVRKPSSAGSWKPGTPVSLGGGSATSSTPVYYGLPDLAVTLEAVGYFSGTSTDSIIATTTIPAHAQVALKFKVINLGTNVSGPWSVRISVPSGEPLNQTFTQTSLLPGQPSEYVARIGNLAPGAGTTVSVTVDPDRLVQDSNRANNAATTTITVLGS